MQRGDVCFVDLDPARGGEANKQRPAIIVSNDGANRTATRLGRGVVTVVPITSNVAPVYPFQVPIPAGEGGLPQDSKAQAEQVRSIAAGLVGEPIGRLPGTLMASVDDALRLHLAL